MKNTSLNVFSVVKNVESFIKNEKDVNIFKKQSKLWFERSSEYIQRNCKRLFNEIENSFYDYYDLAIFLLYDLIFNEKNSLRNVNDKNINKVKNLFTLEQLKKDQDFILELNKQLNFTDLSEYFKINSSGGNLLYDNLILPKHISPYFYLEFDINKEDEKEKEKEKEELKKFKKIIKKIKELKKEKKENG